MKKDKKIHGMKQPQSPQTGRFSLLVNALVAAGALSSLSLPAAVASTLAPLPVAVGLPCGGCATVAAMPGSFVQMGNVYTDNIDPKTGLPVSTNLTVHQASQVAILNWQQFNIDKGYSVNFVQPNSTSSALNKIWDANPSTIAGSLTANGQIYLINHNGIVFADGAQVNTGALIASSLDISDTLFSAGYLTNTQVIPAFSGVGGFIRVDSGAVLNGSRIMLFAPVVENGGSINTPDGQAVLAAGNKVYLEASQDPNLRGVLVEVDVTNPGAPVTVANDPATGKPYVLQHNAAGTVSNVQGAKPADGISADRGNITLVGFAVNQQGRLSATTSVTENGSIKLLARYNVAAQSPATTNASATGQGVPTWDIRAQNTGKVTLASGSVTQVNPDLNDNSTTTDGQGFKPSIVEVMGSTINMQSGSSIVAHGGQVTLAAMGSIDPTVGLGHVYQEISSANANSGFLNPTYKPVADGKARVFLDSGSSIDVSGSQASVSVARNILAVQLRGSQLADAPVQRNGFLWGKNVLIDIRQGSTLANYAGEEAQIGRTVSERTSSGGSVNLVSTGDVVMKSGSRVDLSGGQINYTGANIRATTLISNGVAYDIANAPADRIYNGISGTYSVTHNKWGVTETFTTLAGGDSRGRWDPGYVEGKSAGTLTVLAPNAVLNGDIVARTVAGAFQRQAFVDPTTLATNNYKNTWQMLPQGGTLVIGDKTAVADTNSGIINYITENNVTIQNGTTPLAGNFTLFDALGNLNALPAQDITVDSGLLSSGTGLKRLEVYSNNKVEVASGTSVKLSAGGAITLKGNTVNLYGTIDAPAGTVVLDTALRTKGHAAMGAINVGAAGTGTYISTRGQWVNDALQTAGIPDLSKPLLYNGGNITLNSGGDLQVATGTVLDASGGAWLDASSKLHGGNGGAITIASGGMNGLNPYKAQADHFVLRSYGTAGGKGGKLNIKAANIYLGTAGIIDPLNTLDRNTNLILSPEFFQSGGFNSYNVTAQGLGGLTVTSGTVIEPKVKSLILDRTALTQASGSDVGSFAKVDWQPDWQRAPASIALNASNGAVLIDSGATVRVEPTASISLSASTQLTVLGTLDAAAGSINLDSATGASAYTAQSILLGSESKLLSRGYFLQSQPNAQNLIQGQVLDGGKINIGGNSKGFVVAQKGSLMDVSGASANVDLPQLVSGSVVYRRGHVSGNAGSISITTNEGGYLDGTMNANVEAGSQAAAGAFSLTLKNNPYFSDSSLLGFPHNPAQILVMNGGNGGFSSLLTPGSATASGQFYLDANALQKSGFDQVKLKSEYQIVLADQVNLQTRRSITLDAPMLVSNGISKVASAQVTIGNLGTNQTLFYPLTTQQLSPVAGIGALDVSAQQVDLTGNFVVSGINQLNVASSGDIRLNGMLNAANTALTGSMHTQGNVTLTADQVYPSTMTQFKMSVEDGAGNAAGKITVLPGLHGSKPVMSAGGQLTLSAAEIEQDGVVKAPMGTLNLNATQKITLGTGSTTSVSADGLIIPFGQIQGGNTWVYDLNGTGLYYSAISAPPQKQVQLKAPNIDVQSGATVNLSGGGDLYANEFFAGSGGSVNVLDPTKAPANTFAIIPGISGFAPYDPQSAGQYAQAASKTALQAGASVYLAGGNGLAAGYYTLLPASYALLPGAFRVTAVAGYSDLQPGQGATPQLNGSQIMAGKFAVVGTNIQDARYSGFAVTPGAIVRTQSEYHDSYANQFFTDQATTNGTAVSRLASDAGQLIVSAVISAATPVATLKLDGTINSQPGAGGRGALVDLNGPGFDIVNNAGTGAAGLVELTTTALNKLGAESLLIGGVRTQTATGMNVAVGANEVRVDNAGSVLTGPEIILAANNAVSVKAGSAIAGKGSFSGQASDITLGSAGVNGDGALLRVSSAAQVTVARTNLAAVPVAAKLTVEDGATVGAQNNAVLLDSSYATTVGSKAVLKGKALSVAAQSIDIGTNPVPAATSLAFSDALINQALAFQDLTLHSYTDINLYGAAALGAVDAATGNHLISNLTLNARNINGINNAGSTNIIDAANVTLMNNNSGTSAPIAYGAGNLTINANQITLGAGDKSIQGFDTVKFSTSADPQAKSAANQNQLLAQGTGSVSVNAGDANVHSLVLQSGLITADSKANQTITATNDVISVQPVAGVTATAGEALNAKLTLAGKSITDNGNIDLPAGSVTLHATGAAASDGVTLGAGSNTSAAGFSKTIAGQTGYVQAGTVTLTADNGGVDIQSGATVDVSGAKAGGDAGSINIVATNGAVAVSGALKGKADAKYAQGSFTLDAKALNGTGTINPLTGIAYQALTELDNTLTAGSFNTLRDMRVRTGDLKLEADAPGTTARATAQTFHLTADAGSIDVSGKIDSSGSNGGDILLAAKNNLTLNAGLDAHANGTGQSGGKVTLETAAGVIELNNQLVDVHGDGNTGGSVLLRAPQIKANTDVAVNNSGGTSLNLSPNASVTVEAFRTYTSPAILTAANVAGYYNDATSFANNAAAIKTRLGMTSNQHLTPGVELDSAGNITLASNWDLSGWRFNDGTGALTEAGILTLRAGGNLQFGTADATGTASLTDGFAPPPANNMITDQTAPIGRVDGPSWSYRLVAGADFSAADVMSVKNTVPPTGSPTTGNVVLVKGAEDSVNNTFTIEQVRTGNGFIDITAGGNFNLGNRDSVIYTAGVAADGNNPNYILAVPGNSNLGANSGDLGIRVKGDINGAVNTDQLITEWQWRDTNAWGIQSPGWWINIGSFRQGIGALGGGNVTVTAGGNINSLSASTPTSGYVDTFNPALPTVFLGGGNLSVTAGRDINSGIFYAGNGQGTIRAGGRLGVATTTVGATTRNLYGTILAMDHGNFDVRTGGDLILQTVFNPTVLTQGYSQIPAGTITPYSNFFTYGDSSGVSLTSLSGNVTLGYAPTSTLFQASKNNPVGFFYLDYSSNSSLGAASVYPGSLQVNAMGGSIVSNGFNLFPSTTGQLTLVAAQDIQLGANGRIVMSDATPSDLLANSAATRYSTFDTILRSEHGSVHASDTQSVILSAGGSITGDSSFSSSITLPKSALIEAGQDVKYINLTVQNLNSSDTTSIVSGRDISTSQVAVAGPGQVVLQAGRNVDFGIYNGLTTTGNLTNLLLPEQGASVTVLAGVGQGTTATQAFIDKYIDPAASTSFGNDLIAYVSKFDGVVQGQTAAQAFTAFGMLSQPLQDAFVRQVFFSELKQTGRSAVSSGNYKSGYDAIATLFPSAGYKGDINLYYSQIKTVRGGDINLLTPGGGVNAGLANPSSSGTKKSASQLGIVTVSGGDVNAFVNNDFTVNQSRVFTLQGGNILMWSSYGNIDAGKGSKTVSSTPPPLLVVDPKTGTFNLDVTQSVVGSGIRVLLANKNVTPGDVDLIAPAGTVNAGDAGIGSAGNITIAAQHVIGADNINFGGTSAGVPVAAPAPVSVGLGNLTDASKAADQATQSLGNMNDMNTKDFKPTFLSIEVIGLGDGSNP